MKRKLLTSILLTLICLPALIAANKEKEYFDILAQYRQDIPANVIKKARKEMNYTDMSYARIHDSWIEHPMGKSIDLQGNDLFPGHDYNQCKQISPTHFELGLYRYPNKKYGVLRTDGQVIVPIENMRLYYFPLYNVILATVDWDLVGNGPKKGTVKIYNYYGDLLHTIDGVTIFNDKDLEFGIRDSAKLTLTTDSDRKELSFKRSRTESEQDNLTKFFSEGPQATTYNIIRDLCASNKKGDQKKAMDLIDYYLNYILPADRFSGESSTVSWDATLRYLACLNYTKEYGRLNLNNPKYHSTRMNFQYVPNSVPPTVMTVSSDLPQVKALASQIEPLLNLAANEYQQKLMRDEQRTQAWMAVLGVLANSLSPTGGYVPATPTQNTSSSTAQIPQMNNSGKSMLKQTSISPEITGAAMCAGWVPTDAPSSSSGSSTTSSSSTSSHSSSSNRVCHACFGKGTHQVCNGTGIQLAFGNKRTEKCSYCHGSGKCPQCNGVGHH